MNFKTVFHPLAHDCGVCLTLLIAAAILVPGCAGKRPDLLSSLIPPKAEGEDASVADEADSVAEAANLIAQAEEQEANSRLSAYTDDEIIEGRPGLLHRLRKRFGRDKDAVATTDPFIESDATNTQRDDAETTKPRAPVAETDGPTVEELLASFKSQRAAQPSANADDWWMTETTKHDATHGGTADANWAEKDSTAKESERNTKRARAETEFAEEFDSRLDRLRAELAGAKTTERDVASRDEKADVNPFADVKMELATAESSLLTKSADQLRNATTAQTSDSLTKEASMTEASGGKPRQRIKAMLADARRDWENWNLRRAYRTALDAQELAVLENVQFQADDERPDQLADEIATALRNDVVRPASSNQTIRSKDVVTNDVANAETTPPVDASDPLEQAVASRFNFPEFSPTANPWTATHVATPDASETESSEIDLVKDSASGKGGVSLLPPADDFPSDAARSEWGPSFSALNPISAKSDPEDVQLTAHKSPGFTMTRDVQPRAQLPGLSDKDNKALLTTVAEQRSRVLESKTVEWPSSSAPGVKGERANVKREPIRIAKAPRFALDDAVAATPAPPRSTSSAAPAGGSLLGQFWRSQPVWFIGGLLLLIVALRLLPWPRRETESSPQIAHDDGR